MSVPCPLYALRIKEMVWYGDTINTHKQETGLIVNSREILLQFFL
jgi:hypothetical protein